MSASTFSAPYPQADDHNPHNNRGRARGFRKNWQAASADSALTLYGFRRFKTSHLLNLRFLEEEIAELDHKIYQAGLTLGLEHAPANKLGLKFCKRDSHVPAISETITESFVLKLRDLLKQYCLWPFLVSSCR